jgi:uncharacterized membrane protein YedE/YeeE
MRGMDTDKQENRRSAWVQGGWRVALLVVGLAGIYIGSEKSRPYVIGTVWFLLISVVIGVVMAFVIRWWNERRPVKAEDQEGIRLHLSDDDGPQK